MGAFLGMLVLMEESRMRKLVLTGHGSMLALIALAITACSSGGFDAGPLGAVEVKAGEPIEIRSILSHTGVPFLATPLQAAIELAIEDFGSIEGRSVSVETLDGRCLPEGGRDAGEAVAAETQVVGVIGTSCSAAAVAAMPAISEAGLVMISPSNTSPALTSDLAGNVSPSHRAGYYRVTNNDLIEAGIVANFSYNELGLRTMVTVHDGDAYTSGLANAFTAAFKELGGDVPVIAEVSKGQTDMAAVLAQFDAADPDGIFLPLFPTEGAPLVQQGAQVDGLIGVAMIGGSALISTDFLMLPEVQGFYFAGPDPGEDTNRNQATGKSRAEVLAAFESSYGRPSESPYWGHAYDATTLLLSAIRQVAVVDGDSLYIDRMALREELDSTTDFQGVIGTLTCDEFGDCGTGKGDTILPPDFVPGPLGAVEVGADEPIEIRSLLAHTIVSSVATPLQTAIEIAIKDFGPINGRHVSMETLDEMCSGEGGRATAEAAVADAQVAGVIGTLCSGAAVEAMPVISEAGLSMISPGNTSPVLTSDLAGNAGADYYEGYYRVTNNDLVEANLVANFSYNELGLRRMVTVHDGDAYTNAIANAFAVAFRALGGDVPVIAQVNKGQTDMATVLAAFDAAGPDGIFLPLFEAEGTHLVRQAAEVDGLADITRISASVMFVEGFLALPESEDFYFVGPDLSADANTNQATGRSVDEVLADFASHPATRYWQHAYDATTVLLTAIAEVAFVDGDTLYVDRAALREALDGVSGFEGLIGTITCDDFGDCGTGRGTIQLHADSSITRPSELPIVYSGGA